MGNPMIAQHIPQARSVAFIVPGRIGGKGRHRSAIRAGKIATYTPGKTLADEAVVRQFGAIALRGCGPLVGAVALHVRVYRRHPKSWSAKRRAATHHVTGKPDCDNMLKLIADALNGIAYGDDSQIAHMSFEREYVTEGIESVHVMLQALARVP